jgi:hypothetical protein
MAAAWDFIVIQYTVRNAFWKEAEGINMLTAAGFYAIMPQLLA